uniref:Uncharacterized protein n=1 Tax=Nelumbo nucifera TaxID=4432 RepID=A0A822ZLN1_NELNU|nr:TPA_asm: hypothetical protein HUJ06_016911 [Nelumbo nucifera]
MEVFPSLFLIAEDRDVMVADQFEWCGSTGTWCPKFRRQLNDWEISLFQTC